MHTLKRARLFWLFSRIFEDFENNGMLIRERQTRLKVEKDHVKRSLRRYWAHLNDKTANDSHSVINDADVSSKTINAVILKSTLVVLMGLGNKKVNLVVNIVYRKPCTG